MIKSCEEYVIKELETVKSELSKAKEEINNLNSIIDTYSEDPRKFCSKDFVSTSMKKGKFYSGSTIYRSDFESLKDKFGEDKLREALTNDEVLEELGKFSISWHKGIDVNEYTYDMIITTLKGVFVVTNINDDYSPNIYAIDDTDYSFDEEVIHKNTSKEFRDRINNYLNKED